MRKILNHQTAAWRNLCALAQCVDEQKLTTPSLLSLLNDCKVYASDSKGYSRNNQLTRPTQEIMTSEEFLQHNLLLIVAVLERVAEHNDPLLTIKTQGWLGRLLTTTTLIDPDGLDLWTELAFSKAQFAPLWVLENIGPPSSQKTSEIGTFLDLCIVFSGVLSPVLVDVLNKLPLEWWETCWANSVSAVCETGETEEGEFPRLVVLESMLQNKRLQQEVLNMGAPKTRKM